MYHTGQHITWNTNQTISSGTIRQIADGFYLTKSDTEWHVVRGRDIKEGP
jgi:hypothetical protein